MIDPRLLDTVPLLRDLPRAAKADLAGRAIVRSYGTRQRLWSAGDPPRGLVVILEGRVRVVRSPRGRTRVVHVEGPGATLGEVPLFAGGTYPATAVAAEPTRCLVIDRSSLVAAMASHPPLAWLLLARLAGRLRHVMDRLETQTTDPVIVRLARHLLARHARAAGPFTLGTTQQALAEDLGTAREVVVRLLRGLRSAGLLERIGPSRYRVPDPAALEAVAHDN